MLSIFVFALLQFRCNANSTQSIQLEIGESFDNKGISTGDVFAIDYILTMEGDADTNIDITPPKKVEGCEIISFNRMYSQVSTSYINNRRSDKKVTKYRLYVKAIKIGKHSFGPIKVGDLKSNVVSYTIIKETNDKKHKQYKDDKTSTIDLNDGNSDLFLRAYISPVSVYKQISFDYIIKLYTKFDAIANFDFVSEPEFPNCNVEDTYNVSSKYEIEEIDGIRYLTCIAERFKVTPLKSGKLKIANGKYGVNVNIPIYIHDPFWGRIPATEQQTYILDIPKVEINVKNLQNQVPSDFDGIIGQFNVTSKISNINPQIAESVELSYIISGIETGVENKIDEWISNLTLDNQCEIRKIVNIDSLPEGFKKLSYSIISYTEGVFKIPSLSITYFNPETLDFERIETKEFNVVVGGKRN